MVWAPTTEQILNLDGVKRRVDRFRFELCDRNHTPIGELHPDREQSVPTISVDTNNATPRRLSGLKLYPDEAKDVNILTDRLRVYQQLQNNAEFRLGTFMWDDNNRPERSWGEESHSELLDYMHILNQQTTQVYSWGRGGTITLIIFFLLFRASFELDQIAVIGDAANRGLAEPKAWEPGATWVQELIDLGDVVGFTAPWFDRDGRYYQDEPPDPEVDPPAVSYDEGPSRIVADSIVPSDDMVKSPNDFAVFDSGTDRLRAGRYQLPASAPHSFNNRGWRIGKTESVQGLANQTQANRGARNLARRSDVFEWVTFQSPADPRHDVHTIVEAFGRNWLETAWSLPLRSGGLMTHTMKRVSYDVT